MMQRAAGDPDPLVRQIAERRRELPPYPEP
jgi:hypothetical protein